MRVLQVGKLQKGSSQVFGHSLYERDLEIGRLRKESEKLKRDHALAAGIASLELRVGARSGLGPALGNERALARLSG